jgi:glycosyltransferase involved in cell wall biosynthesis
MKVNDARRGQRRPAIGGEAPDRPGRLTVHAYPARSNRIANPFNYLLSEALEATGCDVTEPRGLKSYLGRADVVHIHWPEHATLHRWPLSLQRSALLVARLFLQRCRGARIVWTVHNATSHQQKSPRLERLLKWFVVLLTHGVIFLSETSRRSAQLELQGLARKPFAVIPHGLYGDYYKPRRSRDEVRAALRIEGAAPVIGFLGDIRLYKGLDVLLDAFEQLAPGKALLLIAGQFYDDDYAAQIRGRVERLALAGHSVRLVEGRLDDAELAETIAACDLVALPYRRIWNSGLALLALENGGRLVTSPAPIFHELESELGSDWITVADDDFTVDTLRAALEAGRTGQDGRRFKSFRDRRSWAEIAARTVRFYRDLGARAAANADA